MAGRGKQGRRREQSREERGGTWINGMVQLLKGGGAAVLTALLVLLACALLVSGGVLPEGAMKRSAAAACVLGGLTGGLLSVRRVGWSTLLAGLGVGIILFLLLLSAGAVLFRSASLSNGGLQLLPACLCGGAMAGILGGRPKKKRKR